MAKVHVFNAGPCLLPQVVLDRANDAIKEFAGTGVSLLCISHRTKEWEAVMDETRALWKELLHIPEGYEVVFLSSGASMEFLYVAMNYLEKRQPIWTPESGLRRPSRRRKVWARLWSWLLRKIRTTPMFLRITRFRKTRTISTLPLTTPSTERRFTKT